MQGKEGGVSWSNVDEVYGAIGLDVEEVSDLLIPGEYVMGLSVNAVFSWRDGKFYEAELSLRNTEGFSNSTVRAETRTRKHLGTAMRRMLILRRGR
jgi:hypothetical protein